MIVLLVIFSHFNLDKILLQQTLISETYKVSDDINDNRI